MPNCCLVSSPQAQGYGNDVCDDDSRWTSPAFDFPRSRNQVRGQGHTSKSCSRTLSLIAELHSTSLYLHSLSVLRVSTYLPNEFRSKCRLLSFISSVCLPRLIKEKLHKIILGVQKIILRVSGALCGPILMSHM